MPLRPSSAAPMAAAASAPGQPPFPARPSGGKERASRSPRRRPLQDAAGERSRRGRPAELRPDLGIGNVDIPYPFGISLGCSRSRDFVIPCISDGSTAALPLPSPVCEDTTWRRTYISERAFRTTLIRCDFLTGGMSERSGLPLASLPRCDFLTGGGLTKCEENRPHSPPEACSPACLTACCTAPTLNLGKLWVRSKSVSEHQAASGFGD